MLRNIFLVMIYVQFAFGEDLKFIRDSSLEIVYDNNTKLIWQDNLDSKSLRINHLEAVSYCKNLKLAGFNDWRLPTLNELETIVDKNKYKPSINQVFQNTTIGFYWSSDIVKGLSSAWYVRFDFGRIGNITTTSKNYARCVRDN